MDCNVIAISTMHLYHSWGSPWQHHVPNVYHAHSFARYNARFWPGQVTLFHSTHLQGHSL